MTLSIVPPFLVETYPAPELLFDVRTTAIQVHAKQRARKRLWTSTSGVCLHQTSCVLGERPERWATVGAHIGITRSGRVMWMHSFDKVVAHGNGWNNHTVGIEIDGLYEGVQGDPSTCWDDPSTASRERGMTLTDEAAEATKACIRWICSEVARHGGKIRALVAHRQASGNRRNDPGSAIWQAVALPLHAELGLTDGGVGFKLEDGKGGMPIPEAWDPRRKGVKY